MAAFGIDMKDVKMRQHQKRERNFGLRSLIKNVKNDQIKQDKLQELGWKVIVIWECELKKNFIMTMEWLEQEIKCHNVERSLR